VAMAGLIVAEVPSFEHQRIHGVSNLNVFRDGRRVLRTILTERRSPRRAAPAQLAMGLQSSMVALVAHDSPASTMPAPESEQPMTGIADDPAVIR
jgi:hypothetical protein